MELTQQPIAALVETAKFAEERSQRHDAFGEIVRRFWDMADTLAYRTLADAHMAQDAVQESFVTAYQNLHQLKEKKAFAGWFRRIVINQCYRLLRGERPTDSIEATSNLPASGTDLVETVAEAELKEKVLAAIQALPEKERIVTKLFYLNGYSQKEIAKLLEVPLTTVKKRLQYARQDLKGLMVAMVDSFTPTHKVQPKPVPIPIPVEKRTQYPEERPLY